MNRCRRIPRRKLTAWQRKAELLCSSKAAWKKQKEEAAVDCVEPGMKAPNSALDGCKESYISADDTQWNASAKYFKDMGLAAMVCKHDIPLFWANIYMAGEGHFYAYALIDELMQHLPPSWRVGIHYDIGCTIHRSVV